MASVPSYTWESLDGESTARVFTFREETVDGDLYDFTGWSGSLRVRSGGTARPVVATATLSLGGAAGTVTASFTGTQTGVLGPGRYTWDLVLTDGAGVEATYVGGAFWVRPGNTVTTVPVSATLTVVVDTVTIILVGDKGPPGDDGGVGPGLPTGGTTGQLPFKASGTNYDTAWRAPLVADLSDSGAVGRSLVAAASVATGQDAVSLRPTNSTNFTTLTGQEPNTVVTSSTITLTGDSAQTFPVRVVGSTGAEVSVDGGYTWGIGATATAGHTLILRTVSPNYGTSTTVTVNAAGRSYTWAITSREWTYADLSDANATLADLRADATFYQQITGSTAATTAGHAVSRWLKTNGLADGLAPANGDGLKLALASGVKVLTGDGTTTIRLNFPTGGITPAPSEWAAAVRARATGSLNTGPYFGMPWSNSARFYGDGSGTVVKYYDDVLGIPDTQFAGPTHGTWFALAVRYVGGVLQVKVHNNSWQTLYTGANPLSNGLTFKVGAVAAYMQANQQVSDATAWSFGLSNTGFANWCSQLGLSS